MEQQGSVAKDSLALPKVGDDRTVAVGVVSHASEVRRIGRRTGSPVTRLLRIRAHRPRESDTVRRIVVVVFRPDNSGWRDPLLDPLSQRQKDIMVGIFRAAEIVGPIEDICAGTGRSLAKGEKSPNFLSFRVKGARFWVEGRGEPTWPHIECMLTRVSRL